MAKEDNRIGALWLKTSKKGTKFMSGTINLGGQQHKFTVFKNNYKAEPKHPDYVIVKPLDKQPEQSSDDLVPF